MQIKNRNDFMIFLINLIGEKFPQSAILKGGMSLRLLNSPRFTNDLDYIFIPYRSKKEIVNDVCELFNSIDGVNYHYSLNSKCLRIKLNYDNIKTQVEINVAEFCPSVSISTAEASSQSNQLSTIIQVMDYPVAMAHKLAAWNERNLIRDLFDLYFFYTFIKVLPDITTLEKRLLKISSTPRNKNPKQMTLKQLFTKLKQALNALSSDDMTELSDYLPANNLIGLDTQLKVNLLQMVNELQRSDQTRINLN